MNNFKLYFKRVLIIALVIYICYILQTSIFPQYQIAGGISPNILLCVVATYGFMKGRRYGILIGFFTGLLLDTFTSNLFGMYALLYMYIGYLNGLFKKQFYGDDLRLPMILIGTSDFLYGVVFYIKSYIESSTKYKFSYYLINIILPEVAYTLVVAIFVYYVILHLNNLMEKIEKKGSDRIGNY
ncbi:MAG: rod shape-determining protein MreD [Pseudobutyrivibrio sp.]|nr:rod shape-determining protein MreD [Pseudobutyrivibrio sp.]